MVGDILALNRIARKLHHRRFENGALRLDNVKLSFKLDGDGNPSTTQIYSKPSFKRQDINGLQGAQCFSLFCTFFKPRRWKGVCNLSSAWHK